ncbi:MAG: hypothetical protein EPN97_15320 [Alphaproteobacteria bacterium]|nr:MAG: hypothetical protein EPN97_15320 [Alphaproteobacteria bacterium]
MNAKDIIIVALIAFLTLPAPRTQAADITSTFNMADLSRSYAGNCDAQAAQRHANILPPHFSGRPAEFLNDSESLVVYSPYLTGPERKTAERLFASIPAYALPIAYRGGVVYVFTRRAIVEAVPALAVEKTWFEDYGVYMQVERRLYVPFEKGQGLTWKRGQHGYTARRWAPTTRDQFRVINHETGHLIDEMLGVYSRDSLGEDGQYRLSNRPDYRAATRADLARLTSSDSPLSIKKIRKLGYYMPRAFNGKRIGIQDEQRARREVFAELWAEAHGHGKSKLFIAYPQAFAVVKSYADFLKAQDAGAVVKCKWGG